MSRHRDIDRYIMDADYKIIVGKKINDWVKRNFANQEDFANLVNIPLSTLRSNIFNGRSAPGAELLAKMAKLGCNIQKLLLDESITIQGVKNADNSIVNINNAEPQSNYGDEMQVNGKGQKVKIQTCSDTCKAQFEMLKKICEERKESLNYLQTILEEARNKENDYQERIKALTDKLLEKL